FHARRTVTSPAAGSLASDIKSSGLHVDAVGIWPLGNVSLFGKLGAIYTNTKTSISTTGAVVLFSNVDRSPSTSELNLKIGLGASYAFTRNIAVRAEFEHYDSVGDSTTGEGDINTV